MIQEYIEFVDVNTVMEGSWVSVTWVIPFTLLHQAALSHIQADSSLYLDTTYLP
jgi:hypothetical protein